MLTKLFNAPKKEDICPDCGTACFATDVLCPHCGGNLDDLFEQLPDSTGTYDFLKMPSKNLSFLHWLTPLILLLSPLIVSLITVMLIALNMVPNLYRSYSQFFLEDVLYSTLVSSVFLLLSVIPLFLSTTPFMRAKIGQRPRMILATLFSIISAIALSLGLSNANIMSGIRYRIGFGFLAPENWVYFVITGGIILIVLNWTTVIEQGKTA